MQRYKLVGRVQGSSFALNSCFLVFIPGLLVRLVFSLLSIREFYNERSCWIHVSGFYDCTSMGCCLFPFPKFEIRHFSKLFLASVPLSHCACFVCTCHASMHPVTEKCFERCDMHESLYYVHYCAAVGTKNLKKKLKFFPNACRFKKMSTLPTPPPMTPMCTSFPMLADLKKFWCVGIFQCLPV